MPLRNRELSWLSFNARVLQEAENPEVPILERLRFLGIFSNNLDEFFRIRVAGLRRLVPLGAAAKRLVGASPRRILTEIRDTVLGQQQRFDKIFARLLAALAARGIHLIPEADLDLRQRDFVRNYFHAEIRKHLIPLMLDQIKTMPALRDQSAYLAVRMAPQEPAQRWRHALIEVPTHVASRFLELPSRRDGRYVMLLDDVIRFCLDDVFASLGLVRFEAYAVKITRDAELDLDDDLSVSLVKKMIKSLQKRQHGSPVRFTYDAHLPRPFHELLVRKLGLQRDDTYLPGQRYHNFRDFIDFPLLGGPEARYPLRPPLRHAAFSPDRRVLDAIRERDVLVHHPYHSFDHINDFLRESAIDPDVTSIRLTIYRAARHSSVITALANAARNGKSVTAVVELQARFDEEANLDWGQRLQREGVHVIYGIPGLKVHAKLCLVTRHEKHKKVRYAVVGTGNFNEDTARIYTDHALFTADPRITKEVRKVFRFCESNYDVARCHHLWVSPFDMRQKLGHLIRDEIRSARAGHDAWITLKLNNLVDARIVADLYRASRAGVRVRLIIRSMFALVPGLQGISDHIEAIGIVDRFLEHTRIFAFGNGGEPLYFISSADLMPRNLDRRLETVCPIYDLELRKELATYLQIQWQDNVKARLLDAELSNRFRTDVEAAPVRAQEATYRWLGGSASAAAAAHGAKAERGDLAAC